MRRQTRVRLAAQHRPTAICRRDECLDTDVSTRPPDPQRRVLLDLLGRWFEELTACRGVSVNRDERERPAVDPRGHHPALLRHRGTLSIAATALQVGSRIHTLGEAGSAQVRPRGGGPAAVVIAPQAGHDDMACRPRSGCASDEAGRHRPETLVWRTMAHRRQRHSSGFDQ